MDHIFISYSKKDIEFARYLRRLLEDQGFGVWMDDSKLVPSEQWWPTIERNIETCAAFLVIMSPNAKGSRWVEREILFAEAQNKAIFPVLYQGQGWPRLAELQYQDMTAGLKAALPSRLAQGLTPLVHGRSVPPPLPGPTITAAMPLPTVRRSYRQYWALGAALAIMFAAAILILVLNGAFGGGDGDKKVPSTQPGAVAQESTKTPELLPTSTTITVEPTETPEPPTVTRTPEPPIILIPSDTPTVTETPIPIETQVWLDLTETQQAFNDFASATAAQWTYTPSYTPTSTDTFTPTSDVTETYAAVMAAAIQTLTATMWTPTPTSTFTFTPTFTPSLTYTPSKTPTPNATETYRAVMMAAIQTQTATAWTITPTATIRSIPAGSSHRAWTVPVINRQVLLIILGGMVIGVVLGGYVVYRKIVRVKSNPITGILSIEETSLDYLMYEVGSVDLSEFNRNTIDLLPKHLGLPQYSPIKRIQITNHGKLHWKQIGQITIYFKMKHGKMAIPTIVMNPNTENVYLYEDFNTSSTYYIYLKNDAIFNDLY